MNHKSNVLEFLKFRMQAILTFMVILILASFSISFAQSQNVNLIENVNDYPQLGYSDVWGYTAPNGDEYALLGTIEGVSIVNVTDPNNIAEVDYIPFVLAPPAGWYDMNTYQNYMYVSTEGSSEILIVDLSPLPDSAAVVGRVTGLSSAPHNIFIDMEMGILYVVEDFNFAAGVAVRLFSLSDPENPAMLSSIGSANNGTDSHDVFAQNSVLYIAEGTSPTIGIFDVSDPANPSLLQRLNIPDAGYVHQVWVSEDNKYMVTTEETPGKTVKIWDIQDLNNISLVSEYLGGSLLAHNAYFKGNFLYISHYESGLKVVDFSDPANLAEVGFYDTFPQAESPNFNGAWGVYPFTRNGMIFISDRNTGLYVLQFEQETGAQIVVAPSGIDFGNVHLNTTSDTLTVTFQNFGTENLIVTDISDPGAPFNLQGVPTLPLTLLPGESRMFTLSYSPTSAGVTNTAITFTSNDVDEPILDIALNGQGFVLNQATAGVSFASTGRQGNNPGSLLTIDVDTGAGTLIGSTGLGPLPGLAINSSGEIYGMTGIPGADLYRIDAVSGGAVFIGSTGQLGIEAIAFDGNNTLYGVGVKNGSDFPNATLYTIDITTGAATPIDTTGAWLTGLAFDPTDGALWGSSGARTDHIYIIDVFTGVATLVGATGLGGSTPDIHFDQAGNLYGVKGGGQKPNNLISIDKTTGKGMVIGAIGLKAVAGMAARLERGVVGVADDFELPIEFALDQNYPNPFNPSTTIKYSLKHDTDVRLQIYNVLGQLVRTLVDAKQTAGYKKSTWDGANEVGAKVANGVYVYRLQAGGFVQTKKLTLLK